MMKLCERQCGISSGGPGLVCAGSNREWPDELFRNRGVESFRFLLQFLLLVGGQGNRGLTLAYYENLYTTSDCGWVFSRSYQHAVRRRENQVAYWIRERRIARNQQVVVYEEARAVPNVPANYAIQF